MHGQDADTDTSGNGGRDVTCETEATPLSKGRARSAHKAARIHAGLEWSAITSRPKRARFTTTTMHVANTALKLEDATHKANAAVPSDTVKINEVADTTKVRGIPIMPEK